MLRMREINDRIVSSYPPWEHASKVPLEANFYVCTTKKEEMSQTLAMQGIEIPNFSYDLSIPKGHISWTTPVMVVSYFLSTFWKSNFIYLWTHSSFIFSRLRNRSRKSFQVLLVARGGLLHRLLSTQRSTITRSLSTLVPVEGLESREFVRLLLFHPLWKGRDHYL